MFYCVELAQIRRTAVPVVIRVVNVVSRVRGSLSRYRKQWPSGTASYQSMKRETTMYEQATSDGGLFAQYMNTLMRIESSGYTAGCTTPQEKYIKRICAHEGIALNHDYIEYNIGRRTVVKIFLNNIWGSCHSIQSVHERVCDRALEVLWTHFRRHLWCIWSTDNQRRLYVHHVQ